MRNRVPITQRPEQFTLNRNSPLWQGLVFAGLGQFPGSTKYHDSACGNDGTLVGFTAEGNTPKDKWAYDSRLKRGRLRFNVNVSYVSVPSGLIASESTFSSWITTIDRTDNVLFQNGADANSLTIGYINYRLMVSNAASSRRWYSASSLLVAGNWYHLSVVRRVGVAATTMSAYLNGVLLSLTTDTSSLYYDTVNGPQIGNARIGPHYWNGDVADSFIHNRILSTSEIQQLADPSNVMLSGLILPPRRRAFAASVATGNRRRRQLICGVSR